MNPIETKNRFIAERRQAAQLLETEAASLDERAALHHEQGFDSSAIHLREQAAAKRLQARNLKHTGRPRLKNGALIERHVRLDRDVWHELQQDARRRRITVAAVIRERVAGTIAPG